MTYSIRIKKSEIKNVATKPRYIWVSKEIFDTYVKNKDRGVWETLEEAEQAKCYSVEEIVIND